MQFFVSAKKFNRQAFPTGKLFANNPDIVL